MVQLAYLGGNKTLVLYSQFLITMALVYHKRPVIWRPAPYPNPTSTIILTLDSISINILLKQLIKTCMKQAQDHPVITSRDDTDRVFRLYNYNFYYGNFYIKYYYYCQHCKNYFEGTRSLGHKQICFCYRLFERPYSKLLVII